MILRCLLLFISVDLAVCSRFETEAIKENIEQGKQKYQELKAASTSEKTGNCWSSAILDLEESCAKLNDESTARLAYAFLTCHLQQHKRKIKICDDEASIESCTETLSDTMFVIYTSFVMHTHNMCFYLQSTTWQQQLDNAVDRLQDNSEQVARNLEIQADKQENLLIGVHAISDMNTDIIAQTTKLQDFIGRMFELVEKINYIQQAFYDHFTTYEMILFYLGSVIVTLLCTSFPGMSSARPTMMCLTAVSLATEQAVIQYGFVVQEDEIARYKAKRAIRKMWLAICVIKWIKTLYSSGRPDTTTQQLLDSTRETHNMVKDLRAQISPLATLCSNSFWCSEDEGSKSDLGTQTSGDLSPLIIKPKKYSKKKSLSPPKREVPSHIASPGRNGTGRYNLRPITPKNIAPLAPPPITWPGFSSDDTDEEYTPGLDVSQL